MDRIPSRRPTDFVLLRLDLPAERHADGMSMSTSMRFLAHNDLVCCKIFPVDSGAQSAMAA